MLETISRFDLAQYTDMYRIIANVITSRKDINELLYNDKDIVTFILVLFNRYVVEYEKDKITENTNNIDNEKARIQYKRDNWTLITEDH